MSKSGSSKFKAPSFGWEAPGGGDQDVASVEDGNSTFPVNTKEGSSVSVYTIDTSYHTM